MLEQARAGVLQVVAASRLGEVCRNCRLHGLPAFLREIAPRLGLTIVGGQLERPDQVVLQIGVGADRPAARRVDAQSVEQRGDLAVEFHADQVRSPQGKFRADRGGMHEPLKIVAAFQAVVVFVEAALEGFEADLAAQREEFLGLSQRRELGIVAFERREPLGRRTARRGLGFKLAERGLFDEAVPMRVAGRRTDFGQPVMQLGPALCRRECVEVVQRRACGPGSAAAICGLLGSSVPLASEAGGATPGSVERPVPGWK